jgi:hypothetical protein
VWKWNFCRGLWVKIARHDCRDLVWRNLGDVKEKLPYLIYTDRIRRWLQERHGRRRTEAWELDMA